MKMLVVATNPYRTVDHLGRPCCACPIDPRDPRYYDPGKASSAEVRGHVGAQLNRSPALLREGAENGDASDPSKRWDVTWQFKRTPFQIPDTRFYRDRIREGALLAADAATAQACGKALVSVDDARIVARKLAKTDQVVDWIDPPTKEVTSAANTVAVTTVVVPDLINELETE
jgi:hypothetical protein